MTNITHPSSVRYGTYEDALDLATAHGFKFDTRGPLVTVVSTIGHQCAHGGFPTMGHAVMFACDVINNRVAW